eukprot:gene17477-35967_t
MTPFRRLLAVDWGTSSLRGALVSPQGHTLEQRFFERGILSVQAGHFAAVFQDCFGDWTGEHTLGLMSGMVGGRQGWQETPYCPCPAGFAELGQHLLWLQPGRIALVPGLSCLGADARNTPDVMRGEEVQSFVA